MSPAPFTILQIKQERQRRIDELYNNVLQVVANRSASLSDPGGQTTTINIPLPPKIFTIVSWNVQTFFAGKSLSNPFVNKIINRILEDLDADVCMLLESREESYVNMNAIEANHVGNKKWKMVANEEDEDAQDVGEDDDTDPPEDPDDDGSAAEDDQAGHQIQFGGEPLRYQQIVSEMTGKAWRPPKRIYVYNKEVTAHFRVLADIHNRIGFEAQLRAGQKLSKYHDKQFKAIVNRMTKDVATYSANLMADPRVVKAAVAASASPKLFKMLCVDEKSGNPINQWYELFGEQRHPFRAYYVLRWLDANFDEQDGVDPSTVPQNQHWRFFFEQANCASCNKPLGEAGCDQCAAYGPIQQSFANLRQVIEEITRYRCTCEESYSVLFRPGVDVFAPSSTGVWLQDKSVSIKSAAARLLLRGPNKLVKGNISQNVGSLLRFSDGFCAFRGRSPFLLPIELWLPYHDTGKMMHTVAFHAPFGEATIAGVQLRADAMRELTKGGVGPTGVALSNAPHAMVIGDFNLDWAPDATKPKGVEQVANELYGEFTRVGFQPMIGGGIATSLISIHGKSKWKSLDGRPTSLFTSSAYDNVFVKSDDIRPFVANSCVIDAIQWIADHLGDFPLPNDDPQKGKIEGMTPLAQAFYIYVKYVSDHLPILVDILVSPMSESAKASYAKNAKQQAERDALMKTGKITQFDVVFTYDAVLEIDQTLVQQDSYQRLDTPDGSLQANFVGVVDSHQDGHLIVICRPDLTQQGQRLWSAILLPINNPRVLRRVLERNFPPGTRVTWKVSNPLPMK